MTNVVSYSNYRLFRSQVREAWQLAADQEVEASKAGDEDLAKALGEKANELSKRYFEMRRANIVNLTSDAPNSGAAAHNRLRKIVSDAQSSLARLDKLASALKGASEILDIATRFLKLI